MRLRHSFLLPLAAGLLAGSVHAQDAVTVDSDTFAGLEARSIGPAAMSGRVSAVDAVKAERLTIYVGAASGGLWKSDDGGVKFKPIFDKYNPSIGAIRIDPKNPKTVWVGTGEAWMRNSVSVGDGVYKTTDGGDNWTKMGLEKTEHIVRIAVDPSVTDTVFVCATGTPFADSPDRGVFRTKDGGKTWEKTLYVAPNTGCSDVSVDPSNSQTLLAGMWQFRRRPDFFTSGGSNSGLHKSTDGGTTWRKITKGLPSGDLGRIAVSYSPVNPKIVFATIESNKTGLYRSDDGGESWTLASTASAVSGRPFYFSNLAADPKNADRVYKATFQFHVSDDGGKTFSTLGGNYHGDVHGFWVNPDNTDEILMGSDGGLYHSWNRGASWDFIDSLPFAQYYHVAVDMQQPYNVYGGLQDNSSWVGPSSVRGEIGNKHWTSVSGGDGFWVFPDANDDDIVYSESQGGNVFRSRKSNGEQKDIKPSPKSGEPKYRYNWNTPIHLSPTQKGTIYIGSQFLFRSRDRGDSWERISPDLTTNDPAKQRQNESGGLTRDNSTAENHTTIFSISESPKDSNVVWVGTDDGNTQITRDGGKTWTNVSANVAAAGVPKGTWVSRVEASPFEAGAAFATFDGHMLGDNTTYVLKTTDFGATWVSLATNTLKGYPHVVRQDAQNPKLLFLGTETGLFVSVNGGEQWAQFTGGLPNVPVRDVVVHPRENDLVLATHGRGIYILDDITPLRALTGDVLAKDAAVLPSRPKVMGVSSAADIFGGAASFGDEGFSGRSAESSVQIAYYLKRRHLVGDLRVEIYDAAGSLLTTIPGSKRRGLNRVSWSPRAKAPRLPGGAGIIPSAGAFFGPRYEEGTYTVKLVKNKDTFEGSLRLVNDTALPYTASDRATQRETAKKLFTLAERLTFLAESIGYVRGQAAERADKIVDASGKDLTKKKLASLAQALESQQKALAAQQEGEGISGEEKLREELGALYGNVNFHDGRPTQSQIDRMGALAKDLDAAWAKFDASAKEAASLSAALTAKKLDPIKVWTEAEWRAKP